MTCCPECESDVCRCGDKMTNKIKPIEEVYPDFDGYAYGYDVLLESWGYNIVIQVDDEDYQGDSRILFYDEDSKLFGYLLFGWGSCSGCDSLQACRTLKEVDDLRSELHESIKWGTSEELLEFFRTHDWKGDYSSYYKEQWDFIGRVIDYLDRMVKSSLL